MRCDDIFIFLKEKGGIEDLSSYHELIMEDACWMIFFFLVRQSQLRWGGWSIFFARANGIVQYGWQIWTKALPVDLIHLPKTNADKVHLILYIFFISIDLQKYLLIKNIFKIIFSSKNIVLKTIKYIFLF